MAVWVVVGVIGAAPLLPWLARRREGRTPAGSKLGAFALAATSVGEVAAIFLLLVVSAAWLASGTYNPFIYFRF